MGPLWPHAGEPSIAPRAAPQGTGTRGSGGAGPGGAGPGGAGPAAHRGKGTGRRWLGPGSRGVGGSSKPAGYRSPPGGAPTLPQGSGCRRGAGVAWEGCLSCSTSRLPSSSASWGQEGRGSWQRCPRGRDRRGSAQDRHPPAPPAPELGGQGAPAHLHGCIRRFCCLLVRVVDESAAPLRQQPQGPDLPKPAGVSAPTPEAPPCSPHRVCPPGQEHQGRGQAWGGRTAGRGRGAGRWEGDAGQDRYKAGGLRGCAHRLKEPCRTFSPILAVTFPTQRG